MPQPPSTYPACTASGAQWHELIASIFGSVEMDLGDRARFQGRIRRSVLGELELNEVTTSYEDAERTRRNISTDTREYYVLVVPRAGSLHLSQNAMECVVTPGSLALFYLNAPHRYFHDEQARILDLKIPAPMLRSRVRHPDRLCATTIRAGSGAARVTLDFVAAMADQLLEAPDGNGTAYAGHLVDTISRLIECERAEPDGGGSLARQAIRARCKALIDIHVGDPELGPALLAARCGISKRYVHAAFQEVGETVGERIRNTRLGLCHDRLRRDLHGRLRIKDLALSTGFRSVAHFCTAFKARYGVSASDLLRDSG